MQAPSAADIRGWNTEQLIQHLQKKFPNKLSQAALDILSDNEIEGTSFLNLTKEKLMAAGMKLGPASVIAGYVEELKGMYPSNLSLFVRYHPRLFFLFFCELSINICLSH